MAVKYRVEEFRDLGNEPSACGLGGWGSSVKAALECRTPYRPRGCARSWQQDAVAGRGEPRPYKRSRTFESKEVQRVHVDEDGGLRDFFGIGVGEGA
jgi:hypothetical protein